MSTLIKTSSKLSKKTKSKIREKWTFHKFVKMSNLTSSCYNSPCFSLYRCLAVSNIICFRSSRESIRFEATGWNVVSPYFCCDGWNSETTLYNYQVGIRAIPLVVIFVISKDVLVNWTYIYIWLSTWLLPKWNIWLTISVLKWRTLLWTYRHFCEFKDAINILSSLKL